MPISLTAHSTCREEMAAARHLMPASFISAPAAGEFVNRTPGVPGGCACQAAISWIFLVEQIGRVLDFADQMVLASSPLRSRRAAESRIRRSEAIGSTPGCLGWGDEALAAADQIVARGSDSVIVLGTPKEPMRWLHLLQRLMAGAGVVPFSGSFLTGALALATTVALADNWDRLHDHGYFPHNEYSAHHIKAWAVMAPSPTSPRTRTRHLRTRR